MAYSKQTWTDSETSGTSITKARMDHIETGIYNAQNDIDSLNDSYIETGTVDFGTVEAQSVTNKTIKFSKTFPKTPRVVICINSGSTSWRYGYVSMSASNATTSQFTATCFNANTDSRGPNAT